MALRYGLPIFLEDGTGRLTGSEFLDLYDRMRLIYRRIRRDSAQTAYGIFDMTDNVYDSTPKIILEFGADDSLGTIRVGRSNAIPMDDYLPRVTIFASSKSRHFVASDGLRYRWRHRYADDQEWACTNSNGDVISYYSLKLVGEPPYPSSGCMLTVEENFAHLASEMLATVMIMRHIAAHNL